MGSTCVYVPLFIFLYAEKFHKTYFFIHESLKSLRLINQLVKVQAGVERGEEKQKINQNTEHKPMMISRFLKYNNNHAESDRQIKFFVCCNRKVV